jgi:nitrogen fixation protein FixH
MLFFATSTFNGLETKKPFEEGVKYNDEIAAEEAQKALHWNVNVQTTQAEKIEEGHHRFKVTVFATDAADSPLTDLQARMEVRRPTQVGYDQDVVLGHVGKGQYTADVDVPLVGQWEMRIYLKQGDHLYRLSKRVILR